MANLSAVHARCLNCKKDVRPDDVNCRGCGDRVKPREINRGRIEPNGPVLPGPGHLRPLDEAAEAREDAAAVERVSAWVRSQRVQLTNQQDRAVEAVRGWYFGQMTDIGGGPRTPFRLFGPAGTGKTTIVRHIADALGVDAVFGAYTGKAASVLQRKGVPATTIHSAIYRPTGLREVKAQLETLQRRRDEIEEYIGTGELSATDGVADELRDLHFEIRECEKALSSRVGFQLNPESEWAHADLIVLDEVSMVNAKMAADIESFGVPVLVLGDPAQLPPIDGGGYYIDAEPDFLLTEVHRQALESPVLALATGIREGRPWKDAVVPVSLAAAMAADQILCWKNSTRWALIEKIRAKQGRKPGVPQAGDRIMCLVNNREAGLLNGQQFQVLGARPDDLGFEIRAIDDEGNARTLQAFAAGFLGLEKEQEAKRQLGAWKGRRGLFTYGFVSTVHKAQGSEWPHVYVVDQTTQMTRDTPEYRRRWAYTAVTRASDRVTLARTGIQ